MSKNFEPYHFKISSKIQTMSNPNPPTLEEVLGNIAAKVLGEREKKQENWETTIEEVREENKEEIEVMVEEEEAITFYSDKGVESF